VPEVEVAPAQAGVSGDTLRGSVSGTAGFFYTVDDAAKQAARGTVFTTGQTVRRHRFQEVSMNYTGCWNGIAIVVGGMLAALAVASASQRFFRAEELQDGHDSTGSLLAIVGTLYAVLLGLFVVDVMSRFDKACDCVQMESNSLADIFHLADGLPEPYRHTIRSSCRTYAKQVVELEWPTMERAQMSVEARMTALALAQSLRDFEPATEAQKIIHPVLLEQIRELWDRRRDRAGTVEYGIPVVEWVTLIVGAVVTVFIGSLMHVASHRLKMAVIAMTALVIGLNLYLICLFGYPFAGELSVADRPFRVDLAIFDGVYDHAAAHAGESHGGPAAAAP
jgi:undecaprenyl pyrophosphate phosphatase UppP